MKKNNTLLELLIGICMVGIILQIVSFLFFKRHLYNAIGLWVGVFVAIGMAIHMQRSIEDGLDLMGEPGVKYMRKAYMTRTMVALVVMGVVMYFDWGNPVTILMGVMALKLAVYLQPLVHKVLQKKEKGGERCGKNFRDNGK